LQHDSRSFLATRHILTDNSFDKPSNADFAVCAFIGFLQGAEAGASYIRKMLYCLLYAPFVLQDAIFYRSLSAKGRVRTSSNHFRIAVGIFFKAQPEGSSFED